MNRSVLSLIAWLEEREAVAMMLGRLPNPGENTAAQTNRWESARKELSKRSPYSLTRTAIEQIPNEITTLARAFVERPDVRVSLNGLEWELGVVGLERVLSFQKAVSLDQISERVAGIERNEWEKLFRLCLPEVGPAVEMRMFADNNGKALTVSSLNPNLRVLSPIAQDVPNAKFFGFGINLGLSFVQVAEYQDRLFLRDGYHRCYGLLRQGITKIPCVFVKARSFAETGAAQTGFFPYEVLFSERPPFLSDFLNDDLATTVMQPAVRKVVRIIAEEFVVEL